MSLPPFGSVGKLVEHPIILTFPTLLASFLSTFLLPPIKFRYASHFHRFFSVLFKFFSHFRATLSIVFYSTVLDLHCLTMSRCNSRFECNYCNIDIFRALRLLLYCSVDSTDLYCSAHLVYERIDNTFFIIISFILFLNNESEPHSNIS